MATNEKLTTQILLLNGTQGQWEQLAGHVLGKGEPAVEFIAGPNSAEAPSNLTAVKVKVGDGFTSYENLPYVGSEIAAELATLVTKVNGIEATVNTLGNAVFQIDGTSLDSVTGDTEGDKITAYLTTQNSDLVLKEGNIAIVRRVISGDKASHTAYVYKGSAWIAMDGNYNAENIYFDEDLTTTYAMGNYTLSNGSATIPATGKNLKQLWDAIYLKEDTKINIGSPSIELTVADSGKTVEVGSTFTRPTATLKIKGIGSYEYGSKDASGNEYTSTTATGVTFSSMKVGFGSNIDANGVSANELTAGGYTTNKTLTYTADSDDIESVLVGEGTTSFTFCAEAHHTASDRYPVTNLGNYITAGTISSGVLTGTTFSDNPKDANGEVIAKGAIAASATDGLEKTATWSITGYREGFYFGTSETEIAPTNLTSAVIRGLTTKSGANYAAGTKNVTIPVNAKTVIIACPSDKTGVTDILNTTVNANMNESFGVGGTPTKITVGGKDATNESVGSFGKEYNVWTFTPPEAYGTATNLTITLG